MIENYKSILKSLRNDFKLIQKEIDKYERLIEEEIKNDKKRS